MKKKIGKEKGQFCFQCNEGWTTVPNFKGLCNSCYNESNICLTCFMVSKYPHETTCKVCGEEPSLIHFDICYSCLYESKEKQELLCVYDECSKERRTDIYSIYCEKHHEMYGNTKGWCP